MPKSDEEGMEGQAHQSGACKVHQDDGLIRQALGDDVAEELLRDLAALLGTAAVAYDTSGECIGGALVSGWCRTVCHGAGGPSPSPPDGSEGAGDYGDCHQFCCQLAQECVASGQPVDRACPGGIRVYAFPITLRGRLIGSLLLGYGAPPTDQEQLQALAGRLGHDAGELRGACQSHQPHAPETIVVAKRSVAMAARIISMLVERWQTEQEQLASRRELIERYRAEQQAIEAELDETRVELGRSTWLAAIGRLVAQIAHDLRNPLGAARNAVFYLRRKAPPSQPKWTEYLDLIRSELDVCNQIVGALLEMTQVRKPTTVPVDVGQVVGGAIARLNVPPGVQCRWSSDPAPFIIQADATQIRQVFDNLLANALEAVKDNGAITVRAERNGQFDLITVQDTGPGVAADRREAVFDPFQTTKAQGSGLGLTICRQIVTQHGGTIELTDGDGGGTAVRIQLPRRQAAT